MLESIWKPLALTCVVPAVSAVGIQSREPTLRDRMVAEAFPTEIIEGWWCLCRILGNNTFYSEKWKIIKDLSSLGRLRGRGRYLALSKAEELAFKVWTCCCCSPDCLPEWIWGLLSQHDVFLINAVCWKECELRVQQSYAESKLCLSLAMWPGTIYSTTLSFNFFIFKLGMIKTSLVVQCLRLCFPVQRVWIQSLIGELRSHMSCGQKPKPKREGIL